MAKLAYVSYTLSIHIKTPLRNTVIRVIVWLF